MPSSNLALWPAILHLVYEVAPLSVLDVGPGIGKGGVLLTEYVGRAPRGPIHRLDAVEAHVPYITPMMEAIYDSVYPVDIRHLGNEELSAYDCVVMVDVLEHLTMEDGQMLLDRIPGHVVICTPEKWLQNPESVSIPSEMHRSLWMLKDFGGRLEIGWTQHGGHLVRLKKTRRLADASRA